MKDISKFRKKSKEELQVELDKKVKDLFELKFKVKLGKEKNFNLLSNLRKDIAVFQTIIKEKEILKNE